MQRKTAKSGIHHRTMAAAACDELRRRILEGEFPEGSQLRQDALSKELGVSHIPIREALVQLDSEGLVRIAPHRGAVVAELSLAEIEELFALRALLEPRLLRASAPHLTSDDFTRLDAILSEYGAELEAHNIRRWGELNTALHSLLYAHTGQTRTAAIVRSLLLNTERYTRMQLSLTNGRERAEHEHERLVELCRKGAVDEACGVLEAHVTYAGQSLLHYLKHKARP